MINTATKPATLVGCGIGDALGKSFEMKSPLNPNLVAWDGLFRYGSTFSGSREPHHYTDDTIMTRDLAKSIVEVGDYNPADAAAKYLAWYNSLDHRGMGATTASALINLKAGYSYKDSGLTNPSAGGNGAAMRSSPIGLAFASTDKIREVAFEDASITHNTFEPKVGSFAIAFATSHLLTATSVSDLIIKVGAEIERSGLGSSKVHGQMSIAQALLDQNTDHKEALAKIGTTGWVVHTVAAALYCVAKTTSFRDCVVMAVKGGGDCDTIGAIAGALAATYYGIEGIPEEYKAVEDYDLLVDLTDKLVAMRK